MNDNKTTIAINMNTEALDRLSTPWEQKTMLAWHYACLQLQPKKGPQLINYETADKKTKGGIPRLVELGILKPHATAKDRYYLSRKAAFASVEPTLEAIHENLQ